MVRLTQASLKESVDERKLLSAMVDIVEGIEAWGMAAWGTGTGTMTGMGTTRCMGTIRSWELMPSCIACRAVGEEGKVRHYRWYYVLNGARITFQKLM